MRPAMSGVTGRGFVRAMMRWSVWRVMPSFSAASIIDNPSAGNTSSRRISPGCVGGKARLRAMIVLQVHCVGHTSVPSKRDAPVAGYAHRISGRPKTFQRMKAESGYVQIADCLATFEARQNSFDSAKRIRVHAARIVLFPKVAQRLAAERPDHM